jgi:hypothetical protein
MPTSHFTDFLALAPLPERAFVRFRHRLVNVWQQRPRRERSGNENQAATDRRSVRGTPIARERAVNQMPADARCKEGSLLR